MIPFVAGLLVGVAVSAWIAAIIAVAVHIERSGKPAASSKPPKPVSLDWPFSARILVCPSCRKVGPWKDRLCVTCYADNQRRRATP